VLPCPPRQLYRSMLACCNKNPLSLLHCHPLAVPCTPHPCKPVSRLESFRHLLRIFNCCLEASTLVCRDKRAQNTGHARSHLASVRISCVGLSFAVLFKARRLLRPSLGFNLRLHESPVSACSRLEFAASSASSFSGTARSGMGTVNVGAESHPTLKLGVGLDLEEDDHEVPLYDDVVLKMPNILPVPTTAQLLVAKSHEVNAPPAALPVLSAGEGGGLPLGVLASPPMPFSALQLMRIKQFLVQYDIARQLQEKGVPGLVQLRL
jgi:hypothetical protein